MRPARRNLSRSALLTRAAVALALMAVLRFSPAAATSVLMVSVDGMKPEFVLDADAHALKVPFLRGLVAQGSYARGVTGVWPTVTYPSHTTLVTGVSPAEHGITNNEQFDPAHRFLGGWNWYASAVRVPTLWQSVQAAGKVTASIGWPVTVGARGIDYLIPEYWRITGPSAQLNPLDRNLISAITQPTGLLERLAEEAGPYMPGNDTSVAGDWIKTRYAKALIDAHHPAFLTLHLSSLDDAEHDHGVFSAEALASLEAIDQMLAEVAAASRALDPATVVVVVSDHGFMNVAHEVNLFTPFIKAGLMRTTHEGDSVVIKDWRAQPWPADGMVAIVLHDQHDESTRRTVAALLQRIAADPRNGVENIKTQEQLKLLGAFPEAAFLLLFRPGYVADERLEGNATTLIHGTLGDHGFSPEIADMRSAFFAAGTGIASHRDLGLVDMRQIAPTVAKLLNIRLPSAPAAPLPIEP